MATQGLEVAYINGVRREDPNRNGEFEESEGFVMEVIYIHGGNADGSSKTLKANYPYFIRSKSGDEVQAKIELEDAALSAVNEHKIYDCTTFSEKFELIGNYNTISEFAANHYVVGANVETGVPQWGHSRAALRPFRFYMQITSREEECLPITNLSSMSIVVRGEELPDGTTLIYDVEAENDSENMIFDLSGRRVLEAEKGIYIINGKKVLVK